MPEPKKLSYAELMAADPDELCVEDLQRRTNLTQLKKAERETELVESQNAEFQDKKLERKRVADGKTIIIADENARREREHQLCKHKSGGKGLPGLFNGDGKWGYSVATQELPTGEVYFICFRCQKEWWKPKKRDVLDKKITLRQYKKLEAEYFEVAVWDKPLYNTDSGMIPGSVKFHIPKLIAQGMKDDEDFAAFLEAAEGTPMNTR